MENCSIKRELLSNKEIPRIVYCKPKSKQFIGSYQSEVIFSACLPETDYNLKIDKLLDTCEMFNNNPTPPTTAESYSSLSFDKSINSDKEKGNVYITITF